MEFMDLIEIPRVDNIKVTTQLVNHLGNQLLNIQIDGSLCLTSHHSILTLKKVDKNEEIWILHSSIDSVEQKIRENKFQLILKLKNFQTYLIDFPTAVHCQTIGKSLDGLSNICKRVYLDNKIEFPSSDNMKFPFYNNFNSKVIESDWNLYSIEDEFNKNDLNNDWRISDVNKDFSICYTYPKKLIVPKNISDAELIKSAQFRAGGRLPILSYYHKKNNSFMMRSSQPLLGTSNRRCKEDENLLKSILPMGKKGYIYDLRDASVLKSAASKGGGYETDANYPLWKRINKHLERFEQLQTSFSKLIETCCSEANTNVEKFLSKLESSNWFLNIRQVIYMASCISDELHNKNGCVLVHGWDGFDNTLIVTSLVHVILNPEYRTFKGFISLIEKEWLHAGHPFSKRCFKSAYGSTTQKQEGPTFLLFLDCIRQIMEQFCLSFEFNEDFLIVIIDNVYASEYGTFLGNCQKEREQLLVPTRTKSLWTYINSPDVLSTYLNPLYEMNESAIWPSIYPQSLILWSSFYLRFQKTNEPLKEAKSEIVKMVDTNKQAKEKALNLLNEYLDLQEKARTLGLLE